ncbi:MAG: hypothetical protein LBL94_01605 [Prevotellaceae bacterium]|jgi:hypothetical protein|nr:hypothetical protein [Prevotellaceae bacterium]
MHKIQNKFYLQLLLTLCLSAVSCSYAQAQYISLGADPAGATWSHIRTPHFDVIFPDSAHRQGEHFSRLLERVYLPVSTTLGFRPRKIPIIVHPYNLQSNGMVVWVPSRMEIISTSLTYGYAQPWLEQLALHEYRHVVQTGMMNRGFTRALYYLVGEQAVAFPSALIKPWLFEGDAVGSETAMSYTGRGRLPAFSMGLRAIVLDKKKYSYDKLLLGSLKDYIPNHYEYGYQMMAYGRYRYGADLWGKVFKFTGSYPFLIFPQSIATKKYTGKWSKGFHSEAMLFLDSLWQQERPQNPDKPALLVRKGTSRINRYVSWSNPVALNDGNFLVKKTTLSRTPMLMQVDSAGKATKVAMQGNASSRLAGYKGMVYWTEISPDTRWEQRNYSELWRYDAQKKRVTRLTRKTAYFTPAVNSAGEVAVSEKYASGEQSVTLLDSAFQKSEEVFRFHPSKSIESINDLAWVNRQTIAVLYTSSSGVGIGLVSVQEKKMEPLLPCTYTDISDLSVQDGQILFSSGYDGVNNIYALNVQSKSISKLTNAAYGAFDPLLTGDKSKLIFTDYTSNGYRIASLPSDSLLWKKTAFNAPFKHLLAEAITQQEQFRVDTATLDTAPPKVEKYGKAAHLFRFHSWIPMAYSPSEAISGNFSNVAVGITLLSQNNLSTAVTSLGYKYNRGFSTVNASIAYYGWYPVVELSGSYGTRYTTYADIGNVISISSRGNSIATSRQLYGEINATVSVPLKASKGNIARTFTPYVQLQLNNDKIRLADDPSYTSSLITNVGFSAYLSTRAALRDINPRWRADLSANLQSVPVVRQAYQKVSLNAQAYTPGVAVNHSVRLYGGYERQRSPLMFATRMAVPRGFELENIAASSMVSYSASYALPIYYPDISIGPLAYVKRIRANFFIDRMDAYSEKQWAASLVGAGYEAMVDFNLLRLPVMMISIGWRQTATRTFSRGHYSLATIPYEVLLSISY